VYDAQGRHTEAEQLYQQTLTIARRTLGEKHPFTLQIMNGLANVYFHQRNYAEAEKLYRQTLDIQRRTLGEEHPATARTMDNLAVACANQGRNAEAEQLSREALEILQRIQDQDVPLTNTVKGHLVAFCTGLSWSLATASNIEDRDPAEAVRLAQQAVDLEPDKANNWDNLGVALCSHQEYEQAVEALEKARTMLGGKDAYHQIFLAISYWKVGRRDEALEEYSQNENWLDGKRRPAEEYRFRDEAEELISPEAVVNYWTERIANDPESSEPYLHRAAAYVRADEYDAAAADFVRAMELEPNARWNAASPSFRALMRSEPVFERVAKLRPDDTGLWLERGRYYALCGQWGRAVADYARVNKQPRPDEEYAALLVLTGDEDGYRDLCGGLEGRFAQTDQPGVARALAIICSLSPQSGIDSARIVQWAELALRSERNKFTLQALAHARYRTGEFGEAAKVLKKAMELPQPMPKSEAAFPLALAYRGLGQEEESQKWYRLGVAELAKVTPQNADDPASWALTHWLGVNVWYCEAKGVFEPTGPKASGPDATLAAKAPETTKPEAQSGDETQEPEPSKKSPQPSEAAGGQ